MALVVSRRAWTELPLLTPPLPSAQSVLPLFLSNIITRYAILTLSWTHGRPRQKSEPTLRVASLPSTHSQKSTPLFSAERPKWGGSYSILAVKWHTEHHGGSGGGGGGGGGGDNLTELFLVPLSITTTAAAAATSAFLTKSATIEKKREKPKNGTRRIPQRRLTREEHH